MGKVYKAIFILVAIVGLCSQAIAKEPKVQEWKNGFYQSTVGGHTIYRVDTVSQLCFAFLTGGKSFAVINCENLAKRPEWKPIISWVK